MWKSSLQDTVNKPRAFLMISDIFVPVIWRIWRSQTACALKLDLFSWKPQTTEITSSRLMLMYAFAVCLTLGLILSFLLGFSPPALFQTGNNNGCPRRLVCSAFYECVCLFNGVKTVILQSPCNWNRGAEPLTRSANLAEVGVVSVLWGWSWSSSCCLAVRAQRLEGAQE